MKKLTGLRKEGNFEKHYLFRSDTVSLKISTYEKGEIK